MATAKSLQYLYRASSLHKIVKTFMESSGLYGFDPAKEYNKEETILLLVERTKMFLGRLKLDIEAECTRRSLDHAVSGISKRPSAPRKSTVKGIGITVVSNELVNELVLVWACAILRYPYRGLSDSANLKILKEIVVWFLSERYKYDLPDAELLFHEKAMDWQSHGSLWNLVQKNDRWREFFYMEQAKPRSREWGATIALMA